ncbi:MAG TPA: hypothetical protein VMI75_03155 [Polyangiaceae bacterium]|nr:hypothetical protein [Polyangiaceae bacterium]
MNTTTLSAALAACFLSLSTAACSTTTTASAPRHPAVGFAATTTDLSSGCSLEGMPRVIATHVAPKAGVTATSAGGHVWLRFATTRNPGATVAIDPESLEVEDAADPAPLAAPTLQRGQLMGVDLEDHHRIVAWTEGSAEQGLSVKLATVTDDGSPSNAIDLGYEGSAIGTPALAATPEGKGVVAFIESTGAGFHLVATRVTCGGR